MLQAAIPKDQNKPPSRSSHSENAKSKSRRGSRAESVRSTTGLSTVGLSGLFRNNSVQPEIEEARNDSCDDDNDDVGSTKSLDNDETPENMRNIRVVGGCVRFLKARGYWGPLWRTVGFIVHFLLVMLIMFGGAVVFAYLEDGDLVRDTDTVDHVVTENTTMTHENKTVTTIWADIRDELNVTVPVDSRQNLTLYFRQFLKEEDERQKKAEHRELHAADQFFAFRKWFYFVTIVATTIG